MKSPSDLPAFRYHLSPLESGSIMRRESYCECCEGMVGYLYSGPIFGERYSVCPACIANGKASDEFGIRFVDTERILGAELSEEKLAELTQRTPGIDCGEEIFWPTHCDDACVFKGSSLDLESYVKLDNERLKIHIGILQPYDTVNLFMFSCIHCAQEFYQGVKEYERRMTLDEKKLDQVLGEMVGDYRKLFGLKSTAKEMIAIKILNGLKNVLSKGYHSLFDSASVGEMRSTILEELKSSYQIIERQYFARSSLETVGRAQIESAYFALKGLYFIVFADCVDALRSDKSFVESLDSFYAECKISLAALNKSSDEVSSKRARAIVDERKKTMRRVARIREEGGLPPSTIAGVRFPLSFFN